MDELHTLHYFINDWNNKWVGLMFSLEKENCTKIIANSDTINDSEQQLKSFPIYFIFI
jgi:hypothetical protein